MALTPLRMLEDLVLQAVTELGGSATPQQVIDRIQAMEGFTPTSVDLTRHPGPDGPPAWHSRVRQRWPARSLRKQLHRQEFSYVIRQILAKASSSVVGNRQAITGSALLNRPAVPAPILKRIGGHNSLEWAMKLENS
jgi:hypothetical protein